MNSDLFDLFSSNIFIFKVPFNKHSYESVVFNHKSPGMVYKLKKNVKKNLIHEYFFYRN